MVIHDFHLLQKLILLLQHVTICALRAVAVPIPSDLGIYFNMHVQFVASMVGFLLVIADVVRTRLIDGRKAVVVHISAVGFFNKELQQIIKKL